MNRVIMVVSNAFRPDPRVYREAKSLFEHGFEVTVYAWDRECKYPKNEVLEGIVVKRVHVRSTYGNFPMFMFTAPIFWLLALLRILREDMDVVHCHDFDTLVVGILIKHLKKAQLIFDSHEYYPSMVSHIVPKTAYQILVFTHRFLSAKADAVIIVNDYFKKFFEGSIDRSRTVTILNVPVKAESRRVLEKDATFRVFYYGDLSEGRAIMSLIGVVTKLPQVVLVIAGDGALRKEVLKAAEQHESVNYLGWVSEKEISLQLFVADLIPVLYDPNVENNRLATPNKLFQAMAQGVPMMVYKGTVMEKIIRGERCGISVTYGDAEEIKEAILVLKGNEDLYHELSWNGMRAFKEKYNWGIMEERLVNLYDSLNPRVND